MNHAHLFRRNILIVAVVLIVLIVMVAIAQGATLDTSAAQIDVTRQPRPHPRSHIKITEPGSTLIPRPHPKSHIEMLVSRP